MDFSLLIVIGTIISSVAIAFGALRQKFLSHEKQDEERYDAQQDMLKEIRIDIKMMLLREREYHDRDSKSSD